MADNAHVNVEEAAATVNEDDIMDLFDFNQDSGSTAFQDASGEAAAASSGTAVAGVSEAGGDDGAVGSEGGAEGAGGGGSVSAGAEGPGAPESGEKEDESEEGSVSTEAAEEVKPSGEEPSAGNEVEALKAQIASLTGLVEKLSGAAVKGGPVAPSSTAPTVKDLDLKELLKDVDVDEVLENKENFVNFMSTVLTAVHKHSQESLAVTVPQYVGTTFQQYSSMKETVDGFYRENPELTGVKQYVAFVAKEISQANPEWDTQKVLTEAAAKTKERLSIAQASAGNTTEASPSVPAAKKPSLPGGTRTSRTSSGPVDPLKDEILDLISD